MNHFTVNREGETLSRSQLSVFFYLGQSKIVKVSVVMMGGKKTDLATWKIDEDDDFMGLQILKG